MIEKIFPFALHRPPDLRGLLLVVLVTGWLSGIVLANWLALAPLPLLLLTAVALVSTGFFWRRPWLRYVTLTLFCFCLGAGRYALASPVGDVHAISAFIGSRPVELQGEVIDEPRLEQNSTLLTLSGQSISLDSGKTWQNVHGEVQVQILGATFANPYGPQYGDMVDLSGKLLPPPSYGTPELLASMAFPRMLIGDQVGNPLLVLLYQWRTALAGIFIQVLPQPLAALLIALFLSLRTPALKPLLPFFNVTGTAHLVAPSGFKVTLLAGLLSGGTRWLLPQQEGTRWKLLPAQRRQGNWRRWLRTGLVVLCIMIYTFLSGGGPAALRAGMMGTLLVISSRLDRMYNVYTALALTALLMSAFDPFVLWDTGFQLSFAGTLGIVLFTPFFTRLLSFLERFPLGTQVVEIVAVTLAAQVATLPIFVLSFNQISFIAPLANIMSVPLLGLTLALGALICVVGLLSLQLALICGWLAWPVLWYMRTAITWCAGLPGAYLQVSNLSPILAWGYYALLGGMAVLFFTRWQPAASDAHKQVRPLLSQHTRRAAMSGLALFILLATGAAALMARSDGRLTISLLTLNVPGQGEALLLRSPDGQTALIDEGAPTTTLASTLDAHLPFWQRSLNLVILADTSADNLAGLQDVIMRYQVAQVVDAGMLHPSTAYALWRRTLAEHSLPYTQVRQGTDISLGNQVTFQVLWPPVELHKSSNEEHDNALILRLLAPGLRLLLLNSTSQSDYALKTLPTTLSQEYLSADFVQFTGIAGKAFPGAFSALLKQVDPALLLVMPASSRKKVGAISSSSGTVPSVPQGTWQTLYTEQNSSLEINSGPDGWGISP